MIKFGERSSLFWMTSVGVGLVAIICIVEFIFYIIKEWDRLIDNDGLDLVLSAVLLFYAFVYYIGAYYYMESLVLAFAIACLVKALLDFVVVAIAMGDLPDLQIFAIAAIAVIETIVGILVIVVARELYLIYLMPQIDADCIPEDE